jgi:hypothetical protein
MPVLHLLMLKEDIYLNYVIDDIVEVHLFNVLWLVQAGGLGGA